MRLSVRAVALASAILWGAALLLVGTCNMIWPTYGRDFLDVVASIYPGYHVGTGPGDVLVGTFYGIVDGAVAGALWAVLYNLMGLRGQRSPTP